MVMALDLVSGDTEFKSFYLSATRWICVGGPRFNSYTLCKYVRQLVSLLPVGIFNKFAIVFWLISESSISNSSAKDSDT